MLEQFFWNQSIKHELLLGPAAEPTDTFATRRMTMARDGTLLVDRKPVRHALLFQDYGVTAVLRDAVRVAQYSSFTLWRPTGAPHMGMLETGRYWDGWLAPRGTLEIWPTGRDGGTVSFTLSVPRSMRGSVAMRFGGRTIRIAPGRPRTERIRVGGSGPSSIAFVNRSQDRVLKDERFVSVRSTSPIFTPA